MNEIWKDIPKYEGYYQVSNLGRIKRLNGVIKRSNNTVITIHEKILTPIQHSKYGHLRVALWKNGTWKYFGVHNLVMLSFVGECPVGMEIRHINGNANDNTLSNLQYGTRSENMIDSSKLCRCHNQKLTENQVIQIRKRFREGTNMNQLAREFEVNSGTIHRIVHHKSYNWVTDANEL